VVLTTRGRHLRQVHSVSIYDHCRSGHIRMVSIGPQVSRAPEGDEQPADLARKPPAGFPMASTLALIRLRMIRAESVSRAVARSLFTTRDAIQISRSQVSEPELFTAAHARANASGQKMPLACGGAEGPVGENRLGRNVGIIAGCRARNYWVKGRTRRQ
jgi:hypothetical protein